MMIKALKYLPLRGLALAATFIVGIARAADGASSSAPSDSAFSWTGIHAGLNAGEAFGSYPSLDSFRQETDNGRNNLTAGGQIGYDYQLSPLFVVGIEDDFQFIDKKASNVGTQWFGTGRARAGLSLMDRHLLVYGTAGLGAGEVDGAIEKKMRLGWTAGGGVEWAVLSNISVKLEYLYTDLDKSLKKDSFPDLTAKFNTVRLGVNFHF